MSMREAKCEKLPPHLPRLQKGEKRGEERRGNEKGEEHGERAREKQGRRGSECYSSESSEARQIQRRNPPSSQMNIAAHSLLLFLLLLLLLPSPLLFFSPPPFLASCPLFIIALRVPSSRLQLLLLLQPIRRARWISSLPSLATAPALSPTSIYPSIPRHGDSELALFCC
ncbi:hypothetical protein INR49_025270 [Caranx melampygus]|nr:hypothetical protein INR49_025270 [Caranx melampygus]